MFHQAFKGYMYNKQQYMTDFGTSTLTTAYYWLCTKRLFVNTSVPQKIAAQTSNIIPFLFLLPRVKKTS